MQAAPIQKCKLICDIIFFFFWYSTCWNRFLIGKPSIFSSLLGIVRQWDTDVQISHWTLFLHTCTSKRHTKTFFGQRNCLENGNNYANAIKQTRSTWATSQFVTLFNLKINRTEARLCKHHLHCPFKWAWDAVLKCMYAWARNKREFRELNYASMQWIHTAVWCWFWYAIKLDKRNFDSSKKRQRTENKRGNVFAHISFGKWSKQGKKEWRTLITCAFYLYYCLSFCVYSTSFSLRLSLLPYAVIQCVTIQTPHSVTVAMLTGSLDCLVIQLKQWDPKNPRHISIMLLTECRDATLPGNIRTHPVLFACLLPQKTAALDMRQGEPIWSSAAHPTSPNNPHPHTTPNTSESLQKLESKAFWETGSSVMKANCVL